MMAHLEAIVENGLLRPMQRLPFAEHQRVWVRVEPIGSRDVTGWLASVERHQHAVLTRCGVLPDSTSDIAEDRMRDA